MHRALASEFPNDNSLLHLGAIWVLESPCGSLESVPCCEPAPAATACVAEDEPSREAPSIEPPAEEPEIEAPPESGVGLALEAERAIDVEEPANEVQSTDASAEEPAEVATSPGAAPDGFATFVQALVSIAVAEGSPRAAEALPALLERGRVALDALDEPAVVALLAGGFCVRSDDGLGVTELLSSLVTAWAGVLRRTGDYSACGSITLNEWAADLLAAMLGAPQRAQALQYELRRRGVAAFGMVELAA